MIASSEKLNLRREVDSGEMVVQNGTYAIIPWYNLYFKSKAIFDLYIYLNLVQKIMVMLVNLH